MDDLIKALKILRKYANPNTEHFDWPTNCEHDELMINPCVVNPSDVSNDDIETLEELGFCVDDGHFYSFRFGSC